VTFAATIFRARPAFKWNFKYSSGASGRVSESGRTKQSNRAFSQLIGGVKKARICRNQGLALADGRTTFEPGKAASHVEGLPGSRSLDLTQDFALFISGTA
jgi:hypothetical protein